jgi:hypothetical protein
LKALLCAVVLAAHIAALLAVLASRGWHFVRPLFNITALFEPCGSEN